MKKIVVYFKLLIIAAFFAAPAAPAVTAAKFPVSHLSWRDIDADGRYVSVYSIFVDSRGLAWIGTNNGLFFYDGVVMRPAMTTNMDGLQIYSIIERGGSLYLGSNNGLMVLDVATGQVDATIEMSPREIRTMLAVGDTLWIGGLYGLSVYDFSTGSFVDRSAGLPHRSVYSIMRDSRGIFYVGTYGGLARWDEGRRRFKAVDINLEGVTDAGRFVNCLLESADGSSIYVGSEGALLNYRPSTDSWSRVEALDGVVVKSLANTNDGRLLVGTDDGFYEMNGGALTHYRHDSRDISSIDDNEIWTVFADNSDNIWAGHNKGVSIASNSSARRSIPLSSLVDTGEGNEIYDIGRDGDLNLWLGGTNGVIKVGADGRTRWYRHGDSPKSLSHNHVKALTFSSEGDLFMSTDGGINRYNRQTDDFDVFHVSDSVGRHLTNWVYAIRESGDDFWIGSYLGGIHRVGKSKLAGKSGTVVSEEALNSESARGRAIGMANDQVNNIAVDRQGNLWIILYRDGHLTRLSADGVSTRVDIDRLAGGEPSDMVFDNRGRLWVAFNGGVVVIDGDEPRVIRYPSSSDNEGSMAMAPVGDDIWVSTLSNLWRVDGETLKASLLPLTQKRFTKIFDDEISGKVILGGVDEIVEVDPTALDAAAQSSAIRMALVDDGSGNFDLSNLVGSTEGVTLPYGGSLSLIVSTLDYTPETSRRYIYKLAKSPADTLGQWIMMPEGSNNIVLSDLTMGDYDLLVRAVGSPMPALSIPLTVKAPWVISWWAIILYVIIAAAIVGWIVWYARKRNLEQLHERERRKALDNVEKKLAFLSDISHDLKTPLSMILGPVSLLKERVKDGESRKTLETVYDNAVRLNNMIHRTIELNHLEDSDENLLILSRFDAVQFCKDVFDTFMENNPQKKFVFHSACESLTIEADAVKFESIITNLLSNACKYSDDGSTISLGIAVVDNRAEIVVSDDGVGIKEADQALVFQRLFRSQSTATLHEGTGLGLYLIKKYLELMGGNVELYSREGQGTSFIVTLPLPAEVAAKTAEADDGNADASKPKILVVEDNREISTFIRNLLRRDYNCEIAENGRAGLSVATSFMPDLIIVDEMMPIMKGSEMVRRLKQNPRLSLIPTIMLTAKSDSQIENESVKLGVDAFMTKPFDPKVLTGRISLLLKSRSEMRESMRIQSITQTKPIEAESYTEKQLAKIARVIEENIADPDLNVGQLSEKCDIPGKQLYRVIKKYMGIGPLDYIRRVRLQKAAMLLSQHRFTVAEVTYMVGFKTPSYFAKCFQAEFGVKPSEYNPDDAPSFGG